MDNGVSRVEFGGPTTPTRILQPRFHAERAWEMSAGVSVLRFLISLHSVLIPSSL